MRLDANLKNSNPVLYFRELFAREIERDNGRNPGFIFQQCQTKFRDMLKEGITFPVNPQIHGRIDLCSFKLGKSPAGGVGVLVDESTGQGFTTEIRVEAASQWDVAVNLPFKKEHVIDSLLKVQCHAQPECLSSVLMPFRISDTLNTRAYGGSMDIAVLMSIVAKLNEDSETELLDFICCLAQPGEGDELEEVGHAKSKLEAFLREYGSGTLLIYHAGLHDELLPILKKKKFLQEWEITSYYELAEALSQNGLTERLFPSHELSFGICDAVKAQLEYYKTFGDSRLHDGERLLNSAIDRIDSSTPFTVIKSLSAEKVQLLRRQGKYSEAISHARYEQYDELSQAYASHQEIIESKVQLAASLYDAHEFSEASGLLEHCLDGIKRDQRIVDFDTRIKVFNTAGRVFVQLRDERWEGLLRESLKVQQRLSCQSISRTWNYLAKGLLSENRLVEAARELECLEEQCLRMDEESLAHFEFHQAELNRLLGRAWYPDWIFSEQSKQYHARSFCLQAIARQCGMESERDRLFSQAAEMIDPASRDTKSIPRFLSICLKCARSVYAGNSHGICVHVGQLEAFVADAPKGFRNFYEERVKQLKDCPEVPQVEALITSIPYL